MRRLFVCLSVILCPLAAYAQSPELSLREFASSQIKKGVRSIGLGGNGATWGNNALIYRDAGGALVDAGVTRYTNGNTFSFTALAFTSPHLWHDAAIYFIALSQRASDIRLNLSSPGLGNARPMRGDGSNQGVFMKVALPLTEHFAAGILLSYEASQFFATTPDFSSAIRYTTQWRPSGGLGATWQPVAWLLAGTRFIFNHDLEVRDDSESHSEGLARSYEARLGVSVSPWTGMWLDAGGTLLDRNNSIEHRRITELRPNLGVEQAFWKRAFVVRAGLDETSYTAGVSVKVRPVNLDVAYVYNLGQARVGTLFGTTTHSVLTTLTLDYARLLGTSTS